MHEACPPHKFSGEQPGADLNAAWYLRSAKIFAKQHFSFSAFQLLHAF